MRKKVRNAAEQLNGSFGIGGPVVRSLDGAGRILSA